MENEDIELSDVRDNPAQDRKGMNWKHWVLLLIVFLLLASISMPLVIGKRREAERTKAVGHAKQCFIAFTDFEAMHHCRPSQYVAENGLIGGSQFSTSNDYFRLILQSVPTVRSEAIFYAPSNISKEPDNDIGDSSNHFAEACAKGEVGFLYIDSPTSIDGTPLLVSPLYDTQGKFDADIYKGKAVVLRSDGSVVSMVIDSETGKLYETVGSKRFDILSVENPLFLGTPVIKYPDPK